MTRLKSLFTGHFWVSCFSIKKLISSVLIVYGGLWTFLELTSFFLPKNYNECIKEKWYYFALLGIIVSLIRSIPRLSAKYKFDNTDVEIEYSVKDIFKLSGNHVIPFNAQAEVKTEDIGGPISKKSIQGQLLKKFYNEVAHLESDITTQVTSRGLAKPLGIGEVLKIQTNGNTFYFTVLTSLNGSGNVVRTNFDDVQVFLNKLWQFISEHGQYGEIVIPIIGSGLGRVNKTRNELAREIVKSFTASISEKKFCEKLTICISPNDFLKHKVDLNEIDEFIKYHCKFTEFADNSEPRVGTSI